LAERRIPKDETLRVFHRAFLSAVGYSRDQIVKFGDLENLSAEHLHEPIHRNLEEKLALTIVGKRPRLKILTPKGEKRKASR